MNVYSNKASKSVFNVGLTLLNYETLKKVE
jgi:hypothetical protein